MATECSEMFTRVIRKRVAVEDGATSSDVKGEDARLRAPGVDWNSIVDLRDLCLADFKGKIQSVFETLLHRIGEASVGKSTPNVTSTCATPPPCPAIQPSILGATVTKKAAISSSGVLQTPTRVSTATIRRSPLQECPRVSKVEVKVKRSSTINDAVMQSPPGTIAGSDLSTTIIADPVVETKRCSSNSVMPSVVERRNSNLPSPTPRASVNNTDLGHPQLPRASIAGKKRLRSVSLEKLDVLLPTKRPSTLVTTVGVSEVGSEVGSLPEPDGIGEKMDTANDMGTPLAFDTICVNGNLPAGKGGSGGKEPLPKPNYGNTKKVLQCENFLSNFYARKWDPITAAESVVSTAVGHTRTFLPPSPKSMDKADARVGKQKLLEKVMLKQEEEDKRKRELEARREQERLERIRKREERAKKVMEKNAALRREEDERKRAQEQKSHVQEVQMKKQFMIQQKTQDIHRRVLERQQAAEARKKQEEELKAKKLQELKKAEEARLELLEEEKKQKKAEKMKEKQVKEVVEKIAVGKAKEHDERLKQEAAKQLEAQAQREMEEAKKEQERKRIEMLFASDIVKKPLSNNKKVPVVALPFAPKEQGEKVQGEPQFKAPTPVHSLKNTQTVSYQMTPADPIIQYDNYSIGDLSSGDSTDEESSPKKPIPDWAHHSKLNKWMENQENSVASKRVNVESIFPPKQLLHTPELEKIFKTKRKCFFVRSSSAKWNSPMLK